MAFNQGEMLICKENPSWRVQYLADSQLDDECFIGMEDDGEIFDDYIKDCFRKECDVK